MRPDDAKVQWSNAPHRKKLAPHARQRRSMRSRGGSGTEPSTRAIAARSTIGAKQAATRRLQTPRIALRNERRGTSSSAPQESQVCARSCVTCRLSFSRRGRLPRRAFHARGYASRQHPARTNSRESQRCRVERVCRTTRWRMAPPRRRSIRPQSRGRRRADVTECAAPRCISRIGREPPCRMRRVPSARADCGSRGW